MACAPASFQSQRCKRAEMGETEAAHKRGTPCRTGSFLEPPSKALRGRLRAFEVELTKPMLHHKIEAYIALNVCYRRKCMEGR
jgi:hypothetical protein